MRLGLSVPLLLLSQAQPMAAQPAAPTPPAAAPKVGWQVDWSNQRCVLTLHPGAANQVGFSIRLIPGATRSQLLVFVNTAAIKLDMPKPARTTLELRPAGFKNEIEVAPQVVGESALVLAFNGLESGFLDSFGKADQLSFSVRGETVTVPMKNAAKARQALQQCIDESLVELGLDPKPLASLRDPPKGEWQQLATMTNYPPAALRARKSGAVLFSAVIDREGRVSKCSVVESSGSKELDDQTCNLLTNKARFRPAVAADGSKVAAPLVDAMMWQMMTGRR